MSDNQDFYDRIEQHLAAAKRMARDQLDDPTNDDVLSLLRQICLEQSRLVMAAAKKAAKKAAKNPASKADTGRATKAHQRETHVTPPRIDATALPLRGYAESYDRA
jgi:hypothetical protein